MGVEDVLDLPGPDLEAGGVDHVLLAVHDVQPARAVHEADVPGAQLPVREGRLGGLGQIPVAGDDLRSAYGYLALFAEGDVVAVLVDDPDDGVGSGDTDGQGPRDGVDGRLVLRRHGGAGRGALGESVAVAYVRAEALAELLDQRGRQRRTARRDHLEGGEVLPRRTRVRGQRHEGGRRAHGVGGAVLGEGLQDEARLEAVGEDQGARVGDTGGELAHHAGDVEERGEREVRRALGDGVAGPLPFGVDHDVAVGVHGPLGGAARPGGVADQGGVRSGEFPALGSGQTTAGHLHQIGGPLPRAGRGEPLEAEHARVVGRLEVELAGGDGDPHAGRGLRGGPQIGRPGTVGADQRAHSRVLQYVADLAGLVHRVERDDGRAGLPRPEEREHEVRGVLEHDRDPVTAFEPLGGEVPRDGVGQRVHVAVGEAPVEVGERGVLRGPSDGRPEGVHQGLGGVEGASWAALSRAVQGFAA